MMTISYVGTCGKPPAEGQIPLSWPRAPPAGAGGGGRPRGRWGGGCGGGGQVTQTGG